MFDEAIRMKLGDSLGSPPLQNRKRKTRSSSRATDANPVDFDADNFEPYEDEEDGPVTVPEADILAFKIKTLVRTS